ncbi:Ribosome assembly protein 1 [Babesia sp. Xinjiang]|uniref:Ribosome assembly protein 1 n=1 Tax=Babesia sp. Xinjiang TaxID=462227 RepID=UPI000A232D8C|nr:Ribosome assembly protein 1 [Babesia sp. Xinjiang]ORM39611.1 Ribosome assembly protein 1 [Babesia sp. Xinjiang]
MYVPGPCPNRGNGCPQAGTHDNTHIHLGGFMSDDGLPPFEITVFKSDLTSDLPFTLTADSQVSTGFSWLCLGIYTEEQRASVAGRHEEFYRDLLTTDFMRDSMTKGKDAYGISVSPFAVHSGGAGVDSSIQRVCVGKSEVSKATLTVRSSIQEGSYYVHLAYASPFRDRPMVCFKELLTDMLKYTEHIRNVCFLAHVDHGKTTLSDSLISSIGLFSERMSGRLRYLDNRDDEQRRMITIKSSSISLLYAANDSGNRTSCNRPFSDQPCIINLVDCPGHVDFSVEVSTAARLCDGALLIVDVVEGICPQTKAVLRQAWREGVRTVLVLNKIDKLILDLNMTPAEAYTRLRDLVDQVNALMFQLYNEYLNQNADDDIARVDTSTKKWFFCPSEGNVVCCSAIHRWCVNLPDFAQHIVRKLNVPANKSAGILKALWSDMYYCPRTKALKPGRGCDKPIFVQFVLEQIWRVYDAIMTNWSPVEIEKCVRYTGAALSPRQVQLIGQATPPAGDEREELLTTVMSAWLPIPAGIIRMIVECLHDPVKASKKRLKRICPAVLDYPAYEEVISCSPTAPTVVHVAKFLGCDLNMMRLTGDVLHGDERAGEFVAFARIFSGCLKVGSRLYICESQSSAGGGKFADVIPTDDTRKTVFVRRIMICMGADLIDVETGWPGNIVALYLSPHDFDPADPGAPSDNSPIRSHNMDHVKEVMAWILSLGDPHRQKVKNMGDAYNNRGRFTRQGKLCSVDRHLTLSSDPAFPGFPPLNLEFNNPIIRVSVEPQNVKHTNEFLTGLAYLYISDPAIVLDVLRSGEYVLACCGEIHLERCVNDLANLYAKVPINVSKPRVSVREGVVNLHPIDSSAVAYSRVFNKMVNFPPWQNNATEEQPTNTDPLADMKSVAPIKGMYGVYVTTSALKNGTEYTLTAAGDVVLLVRAVQMPPELLDYMDQNNDDIKRAIYGGMPQPHIAAGSAEERLSSYFEKLESDVLSIWKSSTGQRVSKVDIGHLWAISANRGSRAMLFYNDNHGLQILETSDHDGKVISPTSHKLVRPLPLHWRFRDTYQPEEVNSIECSNLVSAVVSGFEIASQFGPCTEEPLRGVIFVIEGIHTVVVPSSEPKQDSVTHSRSSHDPRTSSGLPWRIREDYVDSDNFSDEVLHDVPEDVLSESYFDNNGELKGTLRIGSNVDFAANEATTCDSGTDDPPDISSQLSDVLTFQSSRKSSTGASSTGNIISAMRNLCRKAVMQRGRIRIYEVLLRLEVQCDQCVLGKIYSVLQKRRTQIVAENVRNGTNTFMIEGLIPASESFGLAQDLRSKASGGVIFHMQYSHWEMNPDDPFPEASMTDEEFEDAGFNMGAVIQTNVPRKIINYIRKMKVCSIFIFVSTFTQGLPTEEKVVASAEKQRTLSTKK